MLRRDEKIKSIPWQTAYVISALVLVLAGCTIIEVPAPKQFDCGGGREEWFCKSRSTGKCIRNTYVEIEACEGIKNE